MYTLFKNYMIRLFILKKRSNIINFKINYNVKSIDIFLYLLYYIYNYYIYFISSYFVSLLYYHNFKNNNVFLSFYINSANYLYYTLMLFFSIFSFNIFKKNLFNQKNYEIISAYLIFFFLLLYYLILNNSLTLVFIFEFQALIIVYILSCLFYFKNNSYLNFKRINKQPS